MTNDIYLLLVALAVLLTAGALVAQAVATVRIHRSVKQLQTDIAPLLPQAQTVLASALDTLSETRRAFQDIGERTTSFLGAAQQQVDEFGKTREEVTTHLKVQMERVDLVLEDTLSRVQEIASTVHGGVIRPAREVAGVIAGIRTALRVYAAAGRPSVDRATLDDEMFI